jgi:hypothetical protein
VLVSLRYLGLLSQELDILSILWWQVARPEVKEILQFWFPEDMQVGTHTDPASSFCLFDEKKNIALYSTRRFLFCIITLLRSPENQNGVNGGWLGPNFTLSATLVKRDIFTDCLSKATQTFNVHRLGLN